MVLPKMWLLLSTCMWLCLCSGAIDTGAGSLHKITINPDANAVMGAVVQVQVRGMGLFGCGTPSREGVVRVEAMRWMTQILNREWENKAFLPNISIGVQVFDSCGRSRVAASHLGELLPMLRGDNDEAALDVSLPALQLGLIDGASLLGDGEVRETLEHFQVPVVTLDSEPMLVSAEARAKAMVALANKMEWRQVVVIHGNDYYSLKLLQTIITYTPDDGSIFVADVQSFTASYDLENSPDYISANSQALDAILTARQKDIPVFVLIHSFGIQSFVESLNKRLNSTEFVLGKKKMKMAFTNLVSGDELEDLSNSMELYSVTVSPSRIPLFEKYWIDRVQHLKNVSAPPSLEDVWFYDYINVEDYCAAHSSDDAVDCNEGDLDVALRTQHVISAGQAVLTLAQALKQAWQIKCTNSTCFTEITGMELDDDPLMYPHSDRGWLTGPNESLNVKIVKYDNFNSKKFEKEMVITSDDIVALASNFNMHAISPYERPTIDQSTNTTETVSESPDKTLQHNRLEAARRISLSNQQELFPKDKDEQVVVVPLELEKNYRILVPSRDNLYIAALFAVHTETHGESLLRCSTNEDDLDLGVVRQLEAFLWALKRVNAKNGLELGAVLLDTCNSRLRTMTLTAGLDSQHVLAAVNALPTVDASVAEEIMAAINITTVSTGHALALAAGADGNSPYILQVEAPLSAMVSAVMSVLQHLGWTYVSVVYSGEGEYQAGFKLFQAAAARAEICLALHEEIASGNDEQTFSELVPRLVGARADGARAILLWTTVDDTRQLMNAVSRAVALGTVAREDFFWMAASPNGVGQNLFRQFGNVLGGALVFRPQHRPIREFQHHLQQVHSNAKDAKSNNNPWLKTYYKQCEDIECLFHLETSYPADMNTVQAVYTIGAAVAQARTQLCSNSTSEHPVDGLCSGQHSRVELQKILNKHLRQSVTERADGAANENFRFTKSGSGNVPTEILNFRRKSNERSRSMKNIYFERVGIWSDSKLSKGLLPMLAYRDTGSEVSVSVLTSQCRSSSCCSTPFRTDRLTIEPMGQNKASVMYIAATFGIHVASANPLECGVDINREGMEQLEAFLWAVEQVNRNNSHLGLAAVALDNCGSIVKTSRAVTDLLSDSVNNSIVALISGEGTEFSNPLLDVVGHLRVPVLYAQAGGPTTHRKTHPPYPLQLAPSNTVQATALLTLLRQTGRKCFTVLYNQDDGEFEEMFKIIKDQVDSFGAGIKLMGAPIPMSMPNISSMIRESLSHAPVPSSNSTAVVVLLLPPDRVDLVLRTTTALNDQGLVSSAHITWVAFGSDQELQIHSAESLGALVLRPKAGRVAEFENYFGSLSLANNTRNPWFPEFWSSVFHCRGASCRSQLYPDLQSYQLKHNHAVVNTINAVLAVAHALGTVRRDLCSETQANGVVPCAEIHNVARVRRRLFEVAPRMAFVGVGMNAVAFSSSGENSHAGMEILNLQPSGFESVGYVDASSNAQLNITRIKSYVALNRTELVLQDAKSYCLGKHAGGVKEGAYLLEIPSNRHLSLLGIVAIGKPGSGMFECRMPQPAEDLQLAVLRYALDNVNGNATLLPGIQLGLTVLDSCSRPTTAHNAVYNFLSTSDVDGRLKSEETFAALTFDEVSADAVAPLLNAHSIMQLVSINLPGNRASQLVSHGQRNKTGSHSNDNLIEAILSLIQSMNMYSYSIIRDATKKTEYLSQRLQNRILPESVCLGGVHTLQNKHNSTHVVEPEDIALLLKPGTLVILLMEDSKQIQELLEICKAFHGIIFIAELQTRDVQLNAGINTVLSLSPSYNLDEHVSNMAAAFAQTQLLQQQRLLEQSNDIQPPTSSLRLVIKQPQQSSAMFHSVIGSVWSVAKGLHNFLDRHCAQRFDTVSVTECKMVNGTKTMSKALEEEILKVVPSLSYDLWNGNEHIGTWIRFTGLKLSTKLPKLLTDCRSPHNCTACSTSRQRSLHSRPALYHNFQYPYAAVLGGLALLGAFLTILTAVYFLVAAALPNNNTTGGTSVLGYFILLGLMLLFTANLSFVLLPTEVTCGVRRFLPGLAYAIIFAGMLLKVLTTWRYGSTSDRERDAASRPAGLLVSGIVVSLIQILLSGGWLVIRPPRVHALMLAPDSPVWRCYPTGNFEAHLLLSLTYVFVLLTATAVFALLCYLSSRKQLLEEWSGEARWILIACFVVAAVLTTWGIATIALLMPHQTDLATGLAHLTAAYVLLLCLYVPKVCLYQRLRATKHEPQSNNLRQIFDITHFQPTTLKTLPAFATPMLGLDVVEVEDDLLDDPTQIVPSSLYSLAMFNSGESDDGDEDASHYEPGTNEFTAPIQHTNPLLALVLDQDPLQESISYM